MNKFWRKKQYRKKKFHPQKPQKCNPPLSLANADQHKYINREWMWKTIFIHSFEMKTVDRQSEKARERKLVASIWC